MSSEDDQDRSKYIMTIKNKTLSSVSVGWEVKINDFKGTYIDKAGVVSLLDVVKDGGLVETGEVGHVLLLVVLRRVHLLHVILGAHEVTQVVLTI